MNLKEIIEKYPDETFLTADGFHSAIIGVDLDSMRLIYSVKKCLKILTKEMSFEDAKEHFEFNIRCAYINEKTPIWCED